VWRWPSIDMLFVLLSCWLQMCHIIHVLNSAPSPPPPHTHTHTKTLCECVLCVYKFTKNVGCHLKILGARKWIWSMFYAEDPQILVAPIYNLVLCVIQNLRFVSLVCKCDYMCNINWSCILTCCCIHPQALASGRWENWGLFVVKNSNQHVRLDCW